MMSLCIRDQYLPLEGELKREDLNKKSQIKIYIFYLFLRDIYFTYPPRGPSRGAQPAYRSYPVHTIMRLNEHLCKILSQVVLSR
jgi:hypothetical protein